MTSAGRVATVADLDALVATFTSAFLHDPVWGPAFPDERRRAEQAAVMWRVYAGSALRYPWTLVTPEVEAAAIFIPPGGVELTEEEAGGLEGRLAAVTDAGTARAIMEVGEQFEAAHPPQPFFYLTILGTHADHRGKGLGMGLVADGLARIDALGELGAPVYLESTNPANNRRYESVGFEVRDEIVIAGGQVVTTMWRPATR
ncbi:MULTISPECIES: N-acetyltransferase [unclassified Streptomyces]|uniref:GNAT family N-acetyltransferase n=1 Tax=unclassified Streptomyces TaxID=2593676 RepID=UPI00190AA7D8|nr:MULTISPECIES: GNAT family N-acetyltransferase [unclassified Streptomyces]MBK3570301.1 GNAT family N-acetyltransferase [Streptomyces sp. MBT62]MBK6015090.1 GNAT family N-acetyltransferase [Streptomyces sp. MBT53]